MFEQAVNDHQNRAGDVFVHLLSLLGLSLCLGNWAYVALVTLPVNPVNILPMSGFTAVVGFVLVGLMLLYGGLRRGDYAIPALLGSGSLISAVLLTACLFFAFPWRLVPAGLPDLEMLLPVHSVLRASPFIDGSIFPNAWIVWTALIDRYSESGHLIWPLWSVLLIISFHLFIQKEKGLLVSAGASLILITQLPVLIGSKVPLPGLAGGALFWLGFLSFRSGIRERNWFLLICSCLCLREAMYLFFPFLVILLSLPLLMTRGAKSTSENAWENRSQTRFVMILLLLILERLCWLLLAERIHRIHFTLFSPGWFPAQGWEVFSWTAIGYFLVILVLNLYRLSEKAIFSAGYLMIALFSMAHSLFVWHLIFQGGDTELTRLLFSNNQVLWALLFFGSVGLLLWMFEKIEPSRLWLVSMFLLQLSMLPLYWSTWTDFGRLNLVLPLLVPSLVLGWSQVSSSLLKWHWGKAFFLSLHVLALCLALSRLEPAFFFSWEEFQSSSLQAIFEPLAADSELMMDRDDQDLLTAITPAYQGNISFISMKRLQADEQVGRSQRLFVLNLPESDLFQLNDRHVLIRASLNLIDEPGPHSQPSGQIRVISLEEIVSVEDFLRSVQVEKGKFTLDMGYNDRGFINSFHKRGRSGSELIYRWSTCQSLIKLPTLHQCDHTITFETIDRFYPQNMSMELKVICSGGEELGVITRTNKSVLLPARFVTVPLTRLSLESETFKPGGSATKDNRQFGVPIDKITIKE